MSLPLAAKAPLSNRLASTASGGKMVKAYWDNLFSARERGATVVWYNGAALNPIFQAIPVGVGEQVNMSVVAEGHELAVGAIFHIVEVVELEGQLADGEAGQKHLDRWRVRHRHQWHGAVGG